MSRNVAFLYPGQGAQHVGMGFDLYKTYTEMRQIFDRADRFLGFSLSRLCFEGPPRRTESGPECSIGSLHDKLWFDRDIKDTKCSP